MNSNTMISFLGGLLLGGVIIAGLFWFMNLNASSDVEPDFSVQSVEDTNLADFIDSQG